MTSRLLTFITCISLFFSIPGSLYASDSGASDSAADGADEELTYYDLILRVGEDVDVDIAYLEAHGVKVLNHRNDICLTLYPSDIDMQKVVDELPSLADKSAGSKGVSAGSNKRMRAHSDLKRRLNREYVRQRNASPNTPAMDISRGKYGLEECIKSADVTKFFPELDGTGVVVGFSDIGFDARHINFRSSDGKELRIKRVFNYIENEGRKEVLSTPDEILAWHTDDDDNFHATHVAGIMTGGYKGNDYYGIAPGADIVAATSRLTDVGILAGIEDIIAYAKEVGKPAVINISLGNYTGAHDGTSLFNQYLDLCAEDAIICIAAGNEGDIYGHVGGKLTTSKKSLQMQFASSDWMHFNMYGITDVYSDTSLPFEVALYMREDGSTGQNFAYSTPKLNFSERDTYILTSDSTKQDEPGYIYSEKFAECMQGEIQAYGEIDPENGRFRVQIFYQTATERWAQDTYGWAHYRIGAMCYGTPGQRIDAFADCSYSRFERVAGNPFNPDKTFSISDLATGYNVLTVGMYTGRAPVSVLNGGAWSGGEIDKVMADSGCATLLDGRVLPHTVAPGIPIISSLSGAYIEKYNAQGITNYSTTAQYSSDNSSSTGETLSLQDEEGGEQLYYWGPYGGTSMACPYVAGVMALYSQIKPDLTTNEALNLIAKTNDAENHPLSENPRNGRGFINPTEGIMSLISEMPTSVESITNGERSYLVRAGRDGIVISNPDAKEISVKVFAVDGKLSRDFGTLRDTYKSIPSEAIPGGVSIIVVESSSEHPITLKYVR